jgi:DNA-binding transcriptional ArsR family regulator
MEKHFRDIASLVGDPVRAIILWTLLDDKAYTATELAICADISAPNASMHLNKLLQAGLLSVETQGRHRYYKFSRQEVAYAIEAMANLIPSHLSKTNESIENNSAIKYCRTCYDHLAGKVGVLITDGLLEKRFIIHTKNIFEVSAKGLKWFTNLGIKIDELKQQRRAFARPCLDWSERRNHIAGSLGASLLDKMLSDDWIRKIKNTRATIVTAKGQKGIYDNFKINA